MARKAKFVLPDGEKYCPKCKQVKSIAEFSGGYCKDCAREYRQRWAKAEEFERVQPLLVKAVGHYGYCYRCGERRLPALSVEGVSLVRANALRTLAQQGWPDGYKMICFNCQATPREEADVISE
jgi:hypothetical protein